MPWGVAKKIRINKNLNKHVINIYEEDQDTVLALETCTGLRNIGTLKAD